MYSEQVDADGSSAKLKQTESANASVAGENVTPAARTNISFKHSMHSDEDDDVRMNDEQKANITGLNADLADTRAKTLYAGNAPVHVDAQHTTEGAEESPKNIVQKSRFIPGLS